MAASELTDVERVAGGRDSARSLDDISLDVDASDVDASDDDG